MPLGTPVKQKKKKKSILKRIRQTARRTEVNRANRTAVRTMIKRLRAALNARDAAGAEQLFRPTLSAIDRAIQSRTLHENTANRYKSRLSIAFNALREEKSPPAPGA